MSGLSAAPRDHRDALSEGGRERPPDRAVDAVLPRAVVEVVGGDDALDLEPGGRDGIAELTDGVLVKVARVPRLLPDLLVGVPADQQPDPIRERRRVGRLEDQATAFVD